MKKLYSLLLLGGLLFFGVQSVLASNYLQGSWDWTKSNNGDYIFVNDTVSVYLAAETSYNFGLRDSDSPDGGTFYKNGGTITNNIDDWVFVSSGNNCNITTTIAGRYTFKVNWYKHDDQNWYPHLSVRYPQQYTPRTELVIGNFGTICLDKKAVSVTGATLYSIHGKNAATPTELYLVEETAPFVAGRPYIFRATNTSIETVLEGFSTSAGSYNGLFGTFEESLSVESTNDNPLYIISNNVVVKAGTGCSIRNGRAYIKMNDVQVTAVPSAPSAIRLDLEENGATSIDAIEASEKAVKFIENGQMYILRGGVKYDATGRVVK